MDKTLQARIDLFAANAREMKKGYHFSDNLIKQMAALLYTAENRPVDPEHIRACYNLIRNGTGAFSPFRSHLHLALAAMLALGGNPETQLENTLTVYGFLKAARFRPTDTLAVAAFEIAAKAKPHEYETVARRAAEFYKGMKRNHWFITGEDDYIYAAMLALTDLDVGEGIAHMEELHAALKPHMRNANSIQALSQVMAVSGTPAASADRVLELRGATIAAGIRMDRQYTLSSLGVLALLPGSAEDIAEDIRETYAYLRTQKGIGLWAISKQSVLLLAGALVATERAHQAQNDLIGGVLATNFNNILIAEYVAIIAATVAISASSSSSSSGS